MHYIFSGKKITAGSTMKGIAAILLLFWCLTYPDIALTQDFEEWKKQQEEEFQQFKDERDAEFLKMLQEAWKEMEAIYSGDDFEEPKPDLIPETNTNLEFEKTFSDESKTIRLDFTELSSETEEYASKLERDESPDLPVGALKSTLNYFNVEIEYFYHFEETDRLKGRPSQKALMNYWADMSGTNYEIIIDRIKDVQRQLNLNDWGTLQAVYRMGKDLHQSSINDVNLFVWFMMTKLGYDMKVGYNKSDIYILFSTNRRLFNTKFLSFSRDKYYIIQLEENSRDIFSMSTYSGSYPDANKIFSVDINKMPKLPPDRSTRDFSFEWQGEKHRFSIPVNENLIDYFKYFPNTDLDIYVNAAFSQSTSSALLQNLGQVIDGKSQAEAVNVLLNFVQTAFDYETDGNQFGKQKYMLPEEILYYPYSDCDDRTILFTFLVRQLLEVDVIGLRYPNHVATAVKLDQFGGGDYVTVNGERYTIADPTYINAQMGMTMTKYQGYSPELIRFF